MYDVINKTPFSRMRYCNSITGLLGYVKCKLANNGPY